MESRRRASGVVFHRAGHAVSGAVAIIQRLHELIQRLGSRVYDIEPAGSCRRAENRLKGRQLLLVFQSACTVRELTKYRHHLLLRRQAFVKLDSISSERRLSLFHFALSVREVDPERFELFCSLLRRSSQAQKALSEGRTRLAALDTGVRHEAGQRGGLFHRRAESLGHRCGILHRLAHELDGRVGICDRIGEHVRHVRRVFRRQSEGRQIIGKNIRRPGEVRPAGCCEGKHGPHTGENLLRLPARHTEVCHGRR